MRLRTYIFTPCVGTVFSHTLWLERDVNIEVTGRRERRLSSYWMPLWKREATGTWKKEALDRSLWRTCFGRGYGPVIM